MEGCVKPIFCWCSSADKLEELLSMMFPNKLTPNNAKEYMKSKQLPRPFKVAVYVPISNNIPSASNFPANPFNNDYSKSGFVPFTIPITGIDNYTFDVLFGSPESMLSYKEFQNTIEKFEHSGSDVTFADFRKLLLEENKTKFKIERGFQDIPMLSFSSKINEPTIVSLISRINALRHEGILSSPKNPYALPNWLEKELLIQDRIVILYTGFLRSNYLKYLVLSYFVMATHTLMQSMRHRINHKVQLIFDEIKSLFPSQHSKTFTEISRAMMNVSTFLITEGRKVKIEPVFISQSPMFLDSETKSNFKTKYVLPFYDEKDLAWLSSELHVEKRLLQTYFNDWYKRKLHRFFICGGGYSSIVGQLWGDVRREAGFELPRPILSYDGAIPLNLATNKPDFSLLQLNLTDEMQKAIDCLASEWRTREEDYIEKFRKEGTKEHMKERGIKEKERKTVIIGLIKFEHMNKTRICNMLGLSRTVLETYLADLIRDGKITEDDLSKMKEDAREAMRAAKYTKEELATKFPEELKNVESFTKMQASEKLGVYGRNIERILERWCGIDGIVKHVKRNAYKYILNPDICRLCKLPVENVVDLDFLEMKKQGDILVKHMVHKECKNEMMH